ncbi:MAG: M6 family metalloprotease domain-containing protein [Candidatus Firestonebacteria bacterium]
MKKIIVLITIIFVSIFNVSYGDKSYVAYHSGSGTTPSTFTYDVDVLIISQTQPPVFIKSFCTMPPHPDLIKKMKQQGRWESFIQKFSMRPAGLDRGAPIKAPVIGIRKAIVLLVDFSDKVATTAKSHYEDLLFSLGTYSTGSMRDYYTETSYSQLDVQGSVSGTGVTAGWYRAPQTYAYYTYNNYGLYGAYPHNAQRLTEDTVNLANPYVNFAEYDNDGDTYVDALFIVHAGVGAETTEDPDDIWSHAWQTSSVMNVDGVKVFDYSMEPEDGKIGVFSHELGHVFGLPDLYDYGYDSQGVGDWCLMASGSWGGTPYGSKPVHPCAWAKIELGWVTPNVPTTNQNNVSFPNIETNQVIYKLWTNGTPANEYFLAENRQQVGFDASLPGTGLMLWHVDDSKTDNDHQWYPGLSAANHYHVAVEPADGLWQLEHNSNYGDTGDPFPGSSNNTAFNNTSTPNSNAYLTGTTNVGVTNISPSGMTMTANIAVKILIPPTVTNVVPNTGSNLVSTTISITGTGFYGEVSSSDVSFVKIDSGVNNYNLTGYSVQSDTTIINIVVASGYVAGTYNVKVTTTMGTNTTSAVKYIVTTPNLADIVSYPNPVNFNKSIGKKIKFTNVPVNSTLKIYTASGELVKEIVYGAEGNIGNGEIAFDGKNDSGEEIVRGIYFYVITDNKDGKKTGKFGVIK